MDNTISPSPTARISPSNSGEDKNSADNRSRKPLKPQTGPKKAPAPPEIDGVERDEKHQLDELA